MQEEQDKLRDASRTNKKCVCTKKKIAGRARQIAGCGDQVGGGLFGDGDARPRQGHGQPCPVHAKTPHEICWALAEGIKCL